MEDFRRFLPAFTEEQLLERAEEYRNVSQDALIESYESLVKEPFQVYVKAATCPILLLAAERGDTIRDSELEVLKAINPRVHAEKVRGVGHMIYKDAPQKTADYIVRFVAAHAPARAAARLAAPAATQF